MDFLDSLSLQRDISYCPIHKNATRRICIRDRAHKCCEFFAIFFVGNIDDTDNIIQTFALKNQALSTSANYERYFNIKEKHYGHLINPLTGIPAESDLSSVSVISSSALETDVLASAFFVLGKENTHTLLPSFSSSKALLIERTPKRARSEKASNYARITA